MSCGNCTNCSNKCMDHCSTCIDCNDTCVTEQSFCTGSGEKGQLASAYIGAGNFPSIKRNDIIIYLYDNKIVVKRCVAVAGDSLDYSADSQYILFTGGNEIALTAEQYDCMKNSAVVPEGYVLAIGDNYSQSIDSRTYGFVPVKNILGKVLWK